MAEKLDPLRPTKMGRCRGVTEMVNELADDKAFATALGEELDGRALIRQLAAIRCTQGLSQQDMAEALGCTQSRISKMEAGADADLKFGDVQSYARAVGLDIGVDLRRVDMTLVERIKRDTLTTRDTLQHIAALSCGDSTMVDGLRGFMYELLANTSWSVAQVEQRFATYARGIPTEKAPTVSYRGDALPVRKAIAPRKL